MGDVRVTPGAERALKNGKPVVTVEQIRSANRKPDEQFSTLKGLGLGKMRRRRTLEDTPAVRGMIRKVQHLVRVVEA